MINVSSLGFLEELSSLEGIDTLDSDVDILEIGSYSALEGLTQESSITTFWNARPPRIVKFKEESPHPEPVPDRTKPEVESDKGAAGNSDGEKEELLISSVYSLEFNELVEEYEWGEKGKLMKQIFSIPKDSTIHIHVRASGQCSFREFLGYLAITNLIKSLECTVVVHISMYITPYSLLAIGIANEVRYGKYVVFNLHGLFLMADDIPPKFKACVSEMNHMLIGIIRDKKLLTDKEINKLREEPQTLTQTRMMFK